MSSQAKTAHVTGLNFPNAGWLPRAGASFSIPGGGAPGILSHLADGFTIAVAVHLAPHEGSDIWDNGAGNAQVDPATEFLVGTISETTEWQIVAFGGNTIGAVFGASQPAALSVEESDQIVMFSYIPDASLYDAGFAAQNVIQAAVNGDFVRSTLGRDQNFALGAFPGDFCIGGITPSLATAFAAADPTAVGGCSRSGISGVWMTSGVPSIAQARAFMEDSMVAGRLVPRPFNPVRTQAGVQPPPPDSPLGYHWDAADLPSTLALGTPWTDKISGLELQLLGSQVGDAGLFAVDPQYYTNLLLQQG